MSLPPAAHTLPRFAVALSLAFATGTSDSCKPSVDVATAGNPSGTVVGIAPMSAPRAAHTATTLPDGRVLVAGGFSEMNRAAQGAELFDVRTNAFAPLPPLITLRHSHTATLLPNGKVLIVGGYTVGTSVIAAAELFDPATNTFSTTGALRTARAGHVAVLLSNGKVLIAGGVGPGWSFLSTAELYDPNTGQFSETGAMTDARESHVAVRLQDGRVLIVGGHRDRRENITLYTSAEVYDATSGVFTRAGEMHIRRHKHDGVVLRDGRVLITGGADERDDRGTYNSTEFFDPNTNTFSIGPSMQRARYKHNGSSIVLPDGTVLLAGGAPEAETFDPVTGKFVLVAAEPPMAGQFSAAASIGQGVLITGGYGNGTGARNAAWLYRP